MPVALYKQEEESNVLNDLVRRATIEPDWFSSNVLLMPNDPFQSELMNAIADLDRIRLGLPTLFNHTGLTRFSVRSCHGTGKTHVMAKVGKWFNFTRRGRIACTAPKESQVKTRLWPEFRKIKRNAMKGYGNLIKIEKTKIVWAGDEDWCALIECGAKSENMGGLHDDYLLFLVDEASGVDEEMFPAIEGSLSTPNSVLVLIGNPTQLKGEFYNSHRKEGTKELYYRMHVRPEDSPRVDMSWITNMKRKYGAKSPVFMVRCLGEFPETIANQLIPLAWIERARNRTFGQDGSHPTKRMSIDVADGGTNESVITIASRYDSFILLIKQYRFSLNTADAVLLLADYAEELCKVHTMRWERGDDIVVDALGVGTGTAAELIRRKLPVVRYIGGAGSDDSKKWLNRRTQSYMCLRDDFLDNKVIFSDTFYEDSQDWEDMLGQLTSIMTNPDITKMEALEAKHRLPISPDLADSLAMQYATQRPDTEGGSAMDLTLIGQTESSRYDAGIT